MIDLFVWSRFVSERHITRYAIHNIDNSLKIVFTYMLTSSYRLAYCKSDHAQAGGAQDQAAVYANALFEVTAFVSIEFVKLQH